VEFGFDVIYERIGSELFLSGAKLELRVASFKGALAMMLDEEAMEAWVEANECTQATDHWGFF